MREPRSEKCSDFKHRLSKPKSGLRHANRITAQLPNWFTFVILWAHAIEAPRGAWKWQWLLCSPPSLTPGEFPAPHVSHLPEAPGPLATTSTCGHGLGLRSQRLRNWPGSVWSQALLFSSCTAICPETLWYSMVIYKYNYIYI